MNKYTNFFLMVVIVVCSAILTLSCDSEFYTVEGYREPTITTIKPCEDNQEGQIVCEDDPKSHGGVLYKCENGNLHFNSICDNNFSCSKDEMGTTKCGECVNTNIETCINDPGSKIGYLTKCENGQISKKRCENNYSCNGNVCASCTDNQDICENDSQTSIGYLKSCNNGQQQTTKCPNDSSCNTQTTCGDCTNGTTKCIDNKLGVCINGTLKKYDCNILGCGTLSTCQSGGIDGIISLGGCLGSCKNGCYADTQISKAYKIKKTDIGGTIEKICPTAKCNADNSGCEDDPVVEPSQGE